jgi:phenylalanyl-tRNA synthetase beta chain
MNVKITHSMVLDFLETDASPEEIQEFVSLGGPNVETITQEGSETVYDIEVTANRIDAASAFGFALECAAILPRYGKKAHIKTNPLQEWSFDNISQGGSYSIDITLADDDLATRVAAIVIENVTIGASPQFIQDRLQACGISVINNVVDISNYVMILLGQPNHTFDYDKIESARMIIRRSKKGEKIMTLDEKEFELPGDDVVVTIDGEVGLQGEIGTLRSFFASKPDCFFPHATLCLE